MRQDLDETNRANERLGRKLAETLAENERLTRELADARRERDNARKENEKLYQWTAFNGVLELEKERKETLAENERLTRELADAIREKDNAISDYRQADTDSIRALHERNEAREDRDSAHKEAERFRNVIQDCKWPKHAFSWENQTQTQ
jgi:chromosome segregation ATPase